MKISEALGALKSGVTFFGQDWKKVSCKSRFFRDFFAEKLKNPLILLNPEKNLKKILLKKKFSNLDKNLEFLVGIPS